MSTKSFVKQIAFRVDAGLLDRIDAFAKQHPLIEGDRSRALRALVEAGLNEVGRKSGRKS
jgi:hypothetical protein